MPKSNDLFVLVCVKCRSHKVALADFRDDLCRKEFSLSAWCQRCQDDFFGGPKPDEPESDEDDIPF